MVEIELKAKGELTLEYCADSIPRVGDYMDISHEYLTGYFKVRKVIHKVFQQKNDGKVISYVTVELETAEY